MNKENPALQRRASWLIVWRDTVDNGFRPMGQGIPRDVEGANEWLDDPWRSWHPLDLADRQLFERAPEAAFLFRLGQGRHNARRLFGVELVFRSGERTFIHDVSHSARISLIVEDADKHLKRCPALAADAKIGIRDKRSLGSWLQLSDIDVYVDGCGSFHIGDELVAFCAYGDVGTFWRNKIIADYRAYRAEHAGLLSEVNMLVEHEVDEHTGAPIPSPYECHDVRFRRRSTPQG